MHYTGIDTLSHVEYDTIHSNNHTDIVVMESFWKYFSSMFPLGPQSVELTLNGLIGQDNGAGSETYDFSFSSGGLDQWGDTLSFQESNSTSDGEHVTDGLTTNILVRIDTQTHTIVWIKATSSEEDVTRGGGTGQGDIVGEFIKNEEIIANNIPLAKNGTVWTGEINGTALSGIIDTAVYTASANGEAPKYESANLTSITGFNNSSTIQISIQ
jgi:hypothetical protein